MLSSLSAKNFKSWKVLPELRMGRITGVFGTNSSGKSALLHLLLLLKQTVEASDRSQPLHLGDDRSYVSLGTFRELIYAHDSDSELSVALRWRLPKTLDVADPAEGKSSILFSGSELDFSTTIGETSKGNLVANEFEYRFAGHRFGMKPVAGSESKYKLVPNQQAGHRFTRVPGRAWELPPPVRFYGFPDQVRAYYQNAGFLGDLELALEEQFKAIHYLGPLRDYPQRQYTWTGINPGDMGARGENAVDAILASRQRGQKISRGRGIKKLSVEEYVAHWLKELDLIDEFGVESLTRDSALYRVWVRKTPRSPRVLITDVGFGVSQILPVITLLYYAPRHSVIVLEQPEIHLHPSVQAGLADVILDAVKIRQVQVIIESHSEHLLRRLQRRIAEEVLEPEDITLYFCQNQRGSSSVTPLELDVFGSIQNWPDDFFGDEMGEMEAMMEAVAERRGIGG